eukprot:1541347-Pleurochrysis_carterae.AAC.3
MGSGYVGRRTLLASQLSPLCKGIYSYDTDERGVVASAALFKGAAGANFSPTHALRPRASFRRCVYVAGDRAECIQWRYP